MPKEFKMLDDGDAGSYLCSNGHVSDSNLPVQSENLGVFRFNSGNIFDGMSAISESPQLGCETKLPKIGLGAG